MNYKYFNADISKWDTRMVTTMSRMFYGCTSFNRDITNFDVSRVTDFQDMFRGATSFKYSDITRRFNLRNQRNFEQTLGFDTQFSHSRSGFFSPRTKQELVTAVKICLQESPKGDCYDHRYGSIEDWDVSYITDMDDLFMNAKFFNADISKWDTRMVTTMSRMFYGATSFNRDIADWDVSRVTDMRDMFRGATSFNHDITHWNVRNVRYFDKMFNDAKSFQFCRTASAHSATESTTRGCFKSSNLQDTSFNKNNQMTHT